MRALSVVTFLPLVACAAAPSPSPSPSPSIGREVVFTGMCDASGAVPLSSTTFVVADDEDSVLRVYDTGRGGAPVATHDLSDTLNLPTSSGATRPAETDLEGGTRLGDSAFWITSHSRNSSGKERPARMRFFATNVPRPDEALRVTGTVYDGLLADLIAEPRLARYDLATASQRAPKAPGGLNVEGLTAALDGSLLIGLRSPVPDGRAVLIPLLNAPALSAGTDTHARFGDPIELDLGGWGVRALSSWRGRMLIGAGNPGDGGRSRLYTWMPGEKPVEVPLDLSIYNPEGFFTPEETDQIMILSDDGTIEVGGTPCKFLDDPAKKSFRAVWIRL